MEFTKICVHWAPNAGVIGVPWITDLKEAWCSDYYDVAPSEAAYDILKLAAGRGMGRAYGGLQYCRMRA
jgi:hypothetical protein